MKYENRDDDILLYLDKDDHSREKTIHCNDLINDEITIEQIYEKIKTIL